MVGWQLAVLVLDERERFDLNSLSVRRKTAQALTVRARIVLACVDASSRGPALLPHRSSDSEQVAVHANRLVIRHGKCPV
jgi:hypothetical protein